jgi:hypothetical protein
MEGTSVSAWQRAGTATNSSVEQDPAVGRWTRHPRGGGAPRPVRVAACGGSLARSAASAPPRNPGVDPKGARRRGVVLARISGSGCGRDRATPLRRSRATAGRSAGAFGRRSEVPRPGSPRGGPDPGSTAERASSQRDDDRRHVPVARSARGQSGSLPRCPVERGSAEPATPRPGNRSEPTRRSPDRRRCHSLAAAARSEPHFGGERTARGEQAPVMGHGYRRGEPSEGIALVRSAETAEASSEATPWPWRNPANPRSGTGLQHARNPRVGKPSRWCETTRTERESRGGSTTRSVSATRPWSGHPRARRRRGTR